MSLGIQQVKRVYVEHVSSHPCQLLKAETELLSVSGFLLTFLVHIHAQHIIICYAQGSDILCFSCFMEHLGAPFQCAWSGAAIFIYLFLNMREKVPV